MCNICDGTAISDGVATWEVLVATTKIEDVEVLRETDDAILVQFDNQELWVPKSVIHDDSEVYEMGCDGTLIIAEWWAEKKGLAD